MATYTAYRKLQQTEAVPGYPKGMARDYSLRRTDRLRRLSVFQCHCHHGRSDNDDENVIVATKRVEFAVNAVKCTSDAQHVQKLAEVQLVFCCFGPATSKKETSVWPSSVPDQRTDQFAVLTSSELLISFPELYNNTSSS